jgi:excinuclease ABC subunit A
VCQGKRYNRETLEIRWKGKNISEVLNLNVEEALRLFQNVPGVGSRLQTLIDVGLSYLQLGQSATTLSGGEAQRVKLARELAKRATGRTLYILDEPTTGLHFHDVAQLLDVLHRLRDEGNTIVVIEHNLDVIKTADWINDLGPDGGAGGGTILVAGTPEEVAQHKASYTAQFLKPLLDS